MGSNPEKKLGSKILWHTPFNSVQCPYPLSSDMRLQLDTRAVVDDAGEEGPLDRGPTWEEAARLKLFVVVLLLKGFGLDYMYSGDGR